MSNRDVRLTIKARDDASATIQKLKQTLNNLENGLNANGKATVDLGSRLKGLGQEATRLQTELANSRGTNNIREQYDLISTTLSRVSSDFRQNRSELAQNRVAMNAAKADSEQYATNIKNVAAALGQEKKALNDANQEVTKHTNSLNKANADVAKYTAQIGKAEAELLQLRGALAGAQTAQAAMVISDNQAKASVDALKASLASLREEREKERKTPIQRVSVKNGITSEMREGAQAGKAANLARYDAEIAAMERQIQAAARVREESSKNLSAANAETSAIEKQIQSTGNLTQAKNRLASAEASQFANNTNLLRAKAAQDALTESVARNTETLQRLKGEAAAVNTNLANLVGSVKTLDAASKAGVASLREIQANLKAVDAIARQRGLDATAQSARVTEMELTRLEARMRSVADLQNRLSRYSDGGGSFSTAKNAGQMQALNKQFQEAQKDAAAFRARIEEIKGSVRGIRMNPQTRAEIKALQQAIVAANADARTLKNQLRDIGIQSGRFQGNAMDAWRSHNNESRTALSLYQRLRGQILSMVGAYVGLFGVVRVVQDISKAYMQQEAALSRLGVVFDGNTERMKTEMDWLRREAARLGIEFGALADEYTKFAVAGNISGFSDDSIRKVFTSVSEAGRVNKLTLDQVKGTYLALSQMISKGKVSAEELRQQLGERLPGAMSLFANALGVTTSELDAMMKKGEVLANEENMLKFAAELDKQFSKQLPASLRTFTTEWGKLQNTIFNARVTAGKGGLIDALTDVMSQLNEYANSAEGVKFFLSLGAALGDLAGWIPTLVENFETLFKFLQIMIAVPLARYIMGIGASLLRFTGIIWGSITAVWGSVGAIKAWQANLILSQGVMARTTSILMGLRAAFMTLGPLALGIGAALWLTSSLSSWESGVDSIVEAQAQHDRIMDSILSKYEEGKRKTTDWKKAVDDMNKTELRENVPKSENLYSESLGILNRQKYGVLSPMMLTGMKGLLPDSEAFALKSAWANVFKDIGAAGRKEFTELDTQLDNAISKTTNPTTKRMLIDLQKEIRNVISSGSIGADTITVLRELGDVIADDYDLTTKFGRSMEEMANGTQAAVDALAEVKGKVKDNFELPIKDALKQVELFQKGLKGMRLGTILTAPFEDGKASVFDMIKALGMLKLRQGEIQNAFKQFAEDGSLDKLAEKLSWMRNVPVLGDLFDRLLSGEMDKLLGDDPSKYKDIARGTGQGWLIRDREGMRNDAYADQKEMGGFSAWRVGYGSDTITDPNTGAVRKTQQGDRITNAEAEADLARRILDYITNITSRISEAKWESLTDDQQEVLLSIAHNYGSVPESILKAVREGTAEDVSKAILQQVRPGSVNNERRTEEARLYASGGSGDQSSFIEAEKKRRDEAEKKAEADKKALEAKKEELAANDENLRLEQMRVDGKEREAFIQEKINGFVKSHGEQSKEELARLREQYGAMYDLQNMKSKDEQTQEAIKKHQEEINRLETERNALLEQRKLYKESGDTEKVAQVDEKLIGINANLDAAIDRFIAFWKAAGGPDSAAGIAALETMKLKLKDVQKEALLTAQQVNERVAGGLADAFGSFAQAIANGDNALKSFRDAFLQFAADFLIEIGKMIIKQTILNMLQNGGGAGGGAGGGFGGMVMGWLGGITTGVFHSGKAPGNSGGANRTVNPMMFSGAQRFHNGRLPGLSSNESAAIIENDEEILTSDNPRHAWNFGKRGAEGAQQAPNDGMTVVNTFDGESFLEAGLSSPRGKKLFMNFVRSNKASIKGALG